MIYKLERLKGVHPGLVAAVYRLGTASFGFDVFVLEGARTLEKQKRLIANGASNLSDPTKGHHLIQSSGFAHAVDIAPVLDTDSDGDTEISWHWPHYEHLSTYMKSIARDLGLPIRWGGDWTSFKDGPHWELPRDFKP